MRGERDVQEDRFFYSVSELGPTTRVLLAVMDGHAGTEAAEICKTALPDLAQATSALPPKRAIRYICSRLAKWTSGYTSGTTLSIVIIEKGVATVGILGDSLVMVIGLHRRVWVSKAQDVHNRAEVKAIEKRGGVLTEDGKHIRNPRAQGNPRHPRQGLAITRTLGDREYEGIVRRQPAIFTVPHPSSVLLTTDGLLSGKTQYRMVPFQYALLAGWKAERFLAWTSLSPEGLPDNATALVWRRSGHTK